jgi:hypothetical protein
MPAGRRQSDHADDQKLGGLGKDFGICRNVWLFRRLRSDSLFRVHFSDSTLRRLSAVVSDLDFDRPWFLLAPGAAPRWKFGQRELPPRRNPKSEYVGGGTLMRSGSLTRSVACRSALFIAALALTAYPSRVRAQSYGNEGTGSQPRATRQALFTTPVSKLFARQKTPYVDAHGEPVVVPANYDQPYGPADGYMGGAACDCGGYGCSDCGGYGGGDCGGYGCSDCDAYGGGGFGAHGHGFGGHGHGFGGFTGPYPMGAGGTNPPVGYDLMGDVGMAGYMVDQRGPHYFDIRAEAVLLERDETFQRNIDFTIFNLNGPIVLSSQQLQYDEEPGFRVLGRFDLGPLSVLEFGYMGIYDFESSASFTDPNPIDPITGTGNLFSLFSDFGTNPPTVAVAGGPMPETERSITHSISIDSDLQTVEMSYRRYWVGFMPRVSGTLLAGFRYTRLREDFLFSTIGEAALDYDLRADNDLAGFQTGADVWIGLLQGLRIGAEGKAGIYNNRYTVNTLITTIPPLSVPPAPLVPPELHERFEDDEVAFIGEASFDIVADILPSWSIRAGYEVLFLNSIVLADENFNTASPYGLPGQAPRIPFVAEQGSAVYHGGHVGVEFIW